MKPLVAALALMNLVGCIHTDSVSANLEGQAPYGIVMMGASIGYLIDARTESCLLVYANTAAAQVSCAKLKKTVPEAARYITWSVGSEDAAAPAPREANLPPPSSK